VHHGLENYCDPIEPPFISDMNSTRPICTRAMMDWVSLKSNDQTHFFAAPQLAIMPFLPFERLDHLLGTRFYVPCKYHPKKFDNATSYFCLDCPERLGQGLCYYCFVKHAERTDHRILQVNELFS
jgi:hypothetical protein